MTDEASWPISAAGVDRFATDHECNKCYVRRNGKRYVAFYRHMTRPDADSQWTVEFAAMAKSTSPSAAIADLRHQVAKRHVRHEINRALAVIESCAWELIVVE